MLTGALLGALGGAGVARAVNVARGQTDDTLRWDDAFLERLVGRVAAALPRRGALWPRPRRLQGRRVSRALACRRSRRRSRAARRRSRGCSRCAVPAATSRRPPRALAPLLRATALRAACRSLSGGDAPPRGRDRRMTAHTPRDPAAVRFRLRITKGEDIAVGPGQDRPPRGDRGDRARSRRRRARSACRTAAPGSWSTP